ncbi:MAG: tRNA (guanosine(37)-N1)-methyltransferase TrmD [Lachnospiraceae bacterium]|nr:tRNA (guanosine(37)-N1)-methyltransferase TrmD [Lachnospiraceae bacterium]
MDFCVLTLFPEMIEGALNSSILKRGKDAGLIDFSLIQIRDFSEDKHKKTDDYPYGGGAGMVMFPDPIVKSINYANELLSKKNNGKKSRVIYLTPWGKPFNNAMAEELAKEVSLIFLCGHYEGIDERALEMTVTDYVSIGDFVVTGGELPAALMIDAISRFVPGVLHNDTSAYEESFSNGLLEYPQYTRPEVYEGKKVPEVLLSGHHANIEKYRRQESLLRTLKYRPELLDSAALTKKDLQFLAGFGWNKK